MRLLAVAIFFTLTSCAQQGKHKIDPIARKLYDSSVLLVVRSHDYGAAIKLLDSVIQIDSTYFYAYSNKITYESELKQFDSALETSKKLNKIRPEDPKGYFFVGLFYRIMKDSISAQPYFEEANKRLDIILDTLNKTSKYYDSFLVDKAFNLIFMGDKQKGIDILKQLYDENDAFKELYKDMIDSTQNKTSQEIVNEFLDGTLGGGGVGKAETHRQ